VLLVRPRKQGALGNLNSTPTDEMGKLLIAQRSSFTVRIPELVELNRQVRTTNQSIAGWWCPEYLLPPLIHLPRYFDVGLPKLV